MNNITLRELVEDVPGLFALFLTLMPDCLLYDSWVDHQHQDWAPEDVASYFGDLVRANREGLKALQSWSSDMQVTIESADALVVLKELRGDFVVSLVFERKTPLGMVRLYTRKLLERLQDTLPQVESHERSPAVRALEFVQRYAPDPHATMLRMSLKTGLTMEQLERPDELDDDQRQAIIDATEDILGLEHIPA